MFFICDIKKQKGKYHGVYICPNCLGAVVLRKDTINTHKKRFDYPKLCSKCANTKAGKKRETHGDHATRLNSTWRNMIQRATNPTTAKAHLYYGKGIDPEWLRSYQAFKDWALTHGYEEHLTIDRIDSSKGYYPDNCRWLTLSENSRLGGASKKRERILK